MKNMKNILKKEFVKRNFHFNGREHVFNLFKCNIFPVKVMGDDARE